MSAMQGTGSPVDHKYDVARIYLPGWWIHAFERAQNLKMEMNFVPDPREDSVPVKLDASEWSVLALVLGQVQKQIFSSKDPVEKIEIEWAQLVRLLSSAESSAVERLQTVFNNLPSLRFLIERRDGSFEVISLFENEVWNRGQNSSDLKLGLTLSLRGWELLSGYTDGHLDLLGKLSGQQSLLTVNHGYQPLVLWTAVWLELNQVEQIVYTRMEAAMQAQGAWFRLDGLIGISLEKLTNGMKTGKKSAQSSTILDRLRLVVKLGRRLVAHGLIQREPSNQYMAITSESTANPPTIMWQASAERLRSKDEAEYFGLVSSRIFEIPLRKSMHSILRVFGTLSGSESFAKNLQDIWSQISVVPGSAVQISPGFLAQAHLLFLEWLARSQSTTVILLPQKLRAHPILSEFNHVTAQNAQMLFKKFIRTLSSIQELFLDNDANYPLTIAHPSFMNFDVLLVKPEKVAEKRVSALPVNRIPVKQDVVEEKKTSPNQLKMRQIAQSELEKMMKQTPQAYADLKQKFLSSVGTEVKDMIMDAQRRLGSKELDRHLKSQIIKYMIEHPGSWNSVSPTSFS
jgi:hypothetical protein